MMRIKGIETHCSLGLVLLFMIIPQLASAQDHSMHHGHHMDASEDEWRMPPMDMSMPMMPGLEAELPPVEPFLPGANMMASMLNPEEARMSIETKR